MAEIIYFPISFPLSIFCKLITDIAGSYNELQGSKSHRQEVIMNNHAGFYTYNGSSLISFSVLRNGNHEITWCSLGI